MQPEIDEVFGHANPNPERVGCPSSEEIEALARRQRPLGDPGYVHLTACSPCYQKFRRMQANDVQTEHASTRIVRVRITVAATLIAAIAGGLVWMLTAPRGGHGPPTPPVPERVEIDLRAFITGRSDRNTADAGAVELPARLVAVSLVLPIGSEPGKYEVSLMDDTRTVHIAGRGIAGITNYLTTCEATLDLRQIAPGPYFLAVRREGESWHMYPAHVR